MWASTPAAAEEQAPPPPPPPTATPPTTDPPPADTPPADTPPAETPAAVAAPPAPTLAPAPPGPATAPATPAPAPGFFDAGQPGDYLAWYGAEYVAVIAGAALLLTDATGGVQPLPALLGPAVDPEAPDLALLFDPRLDDVIGAPILQEKIPALALTAGLAAPILASAGLDLALRQDLHRTHALVLGGTEAVLGAAAVTELLKLSVGRLRPDFRERWVRAACGGVVEAPPDLDCSVAADGFAVDRHDLYDGMKSFPSGHASTAFAAATFVALSVGSEHVWCRDAPEWARPIGAAAMAGLLGGAGFVAATRVEDNRHHLEDVAVGSAIGIASGAAAWLVHFDTEGRARRRWVSVTPLPLAGGAGVAVTGPL